MRLLALLIMFPLVCTGCASAIYKGGRFHDILQSGSDQNRIRAALGEPIKSGEDHGFGNSVYDEFVVRGPVCDSSRAAGAAMGAGMTMGLSEFIAVPQALWWLLTDRGHKTLKVLYSEDSHYSLHFVLARVPGAEPNGAANGSQPIRSEPNRTSSAAGSRR